jgi:hypothetical protein
LKVLGNVEEFCPEPDQARVASVALFTVTDIPAIAGEVDAVRVPQEPVVDSWKLVVPELALIESVAGTVITHGPAACVNTQSTN